MFVEIHFPHSLEVDRDEIEDDLEDALGDDGEVVGAGTGEAGSNLDVEVGPTVGRDDALRVIARVVHGLAPDSGARMRPDDTREWVLVADLVR
jgi:hypothetical protein